MINKERRLAKRFDTPNRCHAVTSTVYSGPAEDRAKKYKEAMDMKSYYTFCKKELMMASLIYLLIGGLTDEHH